MKQHIEVAIAAVLDAKAVPLDLSNINKRALDIQYELTEALKGLERVRFLLNPQQGN